MADFASTFLAQLLPLQVRLYACRERLTAQSDGEALHDLRISLRQLRSLLRPLRGLPLVASLERQAAALGRLSGPLRDREVLLAELHRCGLAPLPSRLSGGLAAERQQLAQSPELQHLLALFDQFPSCWRQTQAEGLLHGCGKRVRRHLDKQRLRLAQTLRDGQADRHAVRLQIKRLRYGVEAYPEYARAVGKAQQARLKHAQSALGDWHDHLQWLAQAAHESTQRGCRAHWREALQLAEQRADLARLSLLADFPL